QREATLASDLRGPKADLHRASIQGKGHLFLEPLQQRHGLKVRIRFCLPAIGPKMLLEVALAIKQGHPYDRQVGIGGRFQMVACQDPKPSTVGGDVGRKANFGTKIRCLLHGDALLTQSWPHFKVCAKTEEWSLPQSSQLPVCSLQCPPLGTAT